MNTGRTFTADTTIRSAPPDGSIRAHPGLDGQTDMFRGVRSSGQFCYPGELPGVLVQEPRLHPTIDQNRSISGIVPVPSPLTSRPQPYPVPTHPVRPVTPKDPPCYRLMQDLQESHPGDPVPIPGVTGYPVSLVLSRNLFTIIPLLQQIPFIYRRGLPGKLIAGE
jgi:hypothetical protein